MSAVTPVSALSSVANPFDGPPARPSHGHRLPVSETEPASSTRVTLGHAPSPDYTDRIQRRPRVSVEAVLAGGGHGVRAAGLSNALPHATSSAQQLTYSFSPQVGAASALDAAGNEVTSEQQQAAMRAMVYLSSMMNVRFVEVAMGGQISFGGAVLPSGGGGGGGGGGGDGGAAAPVGATDSHAGSGGAASGGDGSAPPPAVVARPTPAPAPTPTPAQAPAPVANPGMGLV